jgi:hypothetical protein
MTPPGERSSLEIGVKWANSRPVPKAAPPDRVTFPREAFSTIEEAGRLLRRRAQARRQTFVGRVVGVERQTRTLFDHVAKVTIRSEVDGAGARVRFNVLADLYREACDALRDESSIRITGIIYQDTRAKAYELADPKGFEVIKDPNNPLGPR